jgi:LPS-assembly protein
MVASAPSALISAFCASSRGACTCRAAARVAIGRKWSVFGSGVFNLTDRDEDPVFQPDGFQPIRTRFGVAYSDDCIEFGATWRRDFIDAGDARRGNAFQVFFALRNLGFR